MKSIEQIIAPAVEMEPAGMLELPDSVLVQQACRDAASFSAIYQRYCNRVYRYHYARTGNTQDAQDLTSLTFMAALENLVTYRGEGSLAAWLLSIAHRKMVDHYRRSRPTSVLDDDFNLPHPGPSPEETADRALTFQEVQKALGDLSPERAEALSLRFFGGLAPVEIAHVMGKTEAAVKMLVLRALQDLRVRVNIGVEEEGI